MDELLKKKLNLMSKVYHRITLRNGVLEYVSERRKQFIHLENQFNFYSMPKNVI